MAPFDIIALLGKSLGYMVYLLIGVGFGAVLEMSGFGDSRKLAAQFYLKDMTVLKVMFTAIVVAMVLIFSFSSMQFVDFSRVYVNPTYLIPGILGGLIMGIGFVIGGFCPGTSIVALSTLKVDGFMFAIGVAFGGYVFGESVSLFQGFQNSTFMGRFILPELFGVSTGLMVLLIVLMALVMFYWAEISESFFGKKISWNDIPKLPKNAGKIIASALLVFVALFTLISGQPTPEERWNWIKDKESKNLVKRAIFIHPGELAEVMNDTLFYSTLLDVRNETDYNLFHLDNAKRVTFPDLHDPAYIKKLIEVPDNTVVVVMSNNETDAVKAWKLLRAQGVMNVYILDGGINRWLKIFPLKPGIATPITVESKADNDVLDYRFTKSVGDTILIASNPFTEKKPSDFGLQFERKVKMKKKKVITGGCG